MNGNDEFDKVFKPCVELCKKNNIETGSDAWYINFIQKFFSCEDEYENLLFGSFFCLGYETKYNEICNFDTFKDKVAIKENIIDQTDKSIVDMNVGDIIKFDVNKFEAILKPLYDQKTQIDTSRINFSVDCVESLVLCLYVKNEFDTTHEKEKKERLKQILIDTFLNMLVHLSLGSFLVNNYILTGTINFIKQFCKQEAFYGLHSRLYDYICKFLIKNADKPLNLQQQTDCIEKFLDITLKLNDKDIKLSDKIKSVDKDSNIIELNDGKIPEIKEKKLYFKVVDDKTIILNFNIFDDKDLQDLKVSIDANGDIKSVKKEDQLSSNELNYLNKSLLDTKLFSDESQCNLICLLLGIYLKRKGKINNITDDGSKDILKSFFSEMLKGKNKKSIMTEFKNLKAEKIPDGIYSQLAKIAICCDADSQENFWRKGGDDNSSKFLDKIKIERDKLKDNKDQIWNWIQTELFVTAINKKIGSNKEFKTDLENAIINDLPKDKSLFQSLDEFATFLPTKLKNYFTKEKIQEILGEEWKNFEIKDADLEKLYGINLTSETKTKIIQKFNMRKAKSVDYRLKNEDDVKKTIDTFKKILATNKVSAVDFRNFIYLNISNGVLSSKDIDAILDYVNCAEKKLDVFSGWYFWRILNVLNEQPSEKFIRFMVERTPFDKFNSTYLIKSITILMRKHPAYQENNQKNGIFVALQDILCRENHYKEFSNALLKVPDIAGKIKLENIIKDTNNKDVLGFVGDLMFYGIKIKLEGTGQNKKFTVCAEEHKYSNEVLVELLSKEPELNNWLKDIFAKNEENLNKVKLNEDNKNLAETNSILLNKEITTLADLVSKMSKPKAIKNFINNSKDSERLKKIYKPLLDNDNLLNTVVLDKDTVKWCVSEITSNVKVKSDSLTFDKEKFEAVKTSLENWNIGLKDKQLKDKMICSIVAFFFEDIEKCNSSLYNEKFISMVADMIQKPELNIYLDQYKKNFFSYIKEQLLEVKDNKDLKNHLSIYLENRNRDLEINKLQEYKNNQERKDRINQLNITMSNTFDQMQYLQSTISYYKWLYLFALIPVLGWIFCAILYFYFHKPAFNRVHQLVEFRQPLINEFNEIENNIIKTSLRYEKLIQERNQSQEQSEQLKHDCQILLNFIDPEEQVPPKNIIIDNEQNDNLLNSGARKPLSESNIITIENKF